MCTGLLPPGANPIAVKILIIIMIIKTILNKRNWFSKKKKICQMTAKLLLVSY